MVAFNSSRRQPSPHQTSQQTMVDALAGREESLRDSVEAASSRRNAAGPAIYQDRNGEITQVRIGRWRVLSAAPQRRLAEVRELAAQRIAVRIERFADSCDRPTSEIWQLYDLEGRLEAALQSTPDGRFGLLTNYRTRETCRLVRNAQGELETVEAWKI
jgi:hypothetical protein